MSSQDRNAVLERARRANVEAILVTGTCIKSSRQAQELCEGTFHYPLYFTAGVHPHTAKTCNEKTIPELRRMASSPKCVAIGECGLDFNRNFSPPDVQVGSLAGAFRFQSCPADLKSTLEVPRYLIYDDIDQVTPFYL